ncbi:hypothetical protein ETAA8_19140 [Anatilimnocola aggregata]|uniref:Uncharacterized protein n=1 Tax=Anatilimnocola aggregata TaxID=2528021 RepID=A0A517Y9G3_9BACT|nr:hypothetical protein ETAA8_19140 [Anatilimnocola aggregata]
MHWSTAPTASAGLRTEDASVGLTDEFVIVPGSGVFREFCLAK